MPIVRGALGSTLTHNWGVYVALGATEAFPDPEYFGCFVYDVLLKCGCDRDRVAERIRRAGLQRVGVWYMKLKEQYVFFDLGVALLAGQTRCITTFCRVRWFAGRPWLCWRDPATGRIRVLTPDRVEALTAAQYLDKSVANVAALYESFQEAVQDKELCALVRALYPLGAEAQRS